MCTYLSDSNNVLHCKNSLLAWLITLVPTLKYTRLNYYKNCVLSPLLVFEWWINKLSKALSKTLTKTLICVWSWIENLYLLLTDLQILQSSNLRVLNLGLSNRRFWIFSKKKKKKKKKTEVHCNLRSNAQFQNTASKAYAILYITSQDFTKI